MKTEQLMYYIYGVDLFDAWICRVLFECCLFFSIVMYFFETVILCIALAVLETQSVDQAGPEIRNICLGHWSVYSNVGKVK